MTHRASLIFGRLVMSGSTRAQRGECMTLQAQEVDLAYAKKAWIVRPVRRVATGAAFCFHGYVFIYKGSLLVGVTLRADSISAGSSSDLPPCGCAKNVRAVGTVDLLFIDAVVICLV